MIALHLLFLIRLLLLYEDLSSSNQILIQFNSDSIQDRFDEKIEFALFRILQETLNNAIKHAQSTEISIVLKKVTNTLTLLKSDNGIGFDTSLINISEGIGWKNIYSRLSIINGEIVVQSEKNKGTQLTITIPV